MKKKNCPLKRKKNLITNSSFVLEKRIVIEKKIFFLYQKLGGATSVRATRRHRWHHFRRGGATVGSLAESFESGPRAFDHGRAGNRGSWRHADLFALGSGCAGGRARFGRWRCDRADLGRQRSAAFNVVVTWRHLRRDGVAGDVDVARAQRPHGSRGDGVGAQPPLGLGVVEHVIVRAHDDPVIRALTVAAVLLVHVQSQQTTRFV